MANSRLRNKTALITGATSNIGRAIAAGFAAEGAHAVASGRSPERGAELVEEIKHTSPISPRQPTTGCQQHWLPDSRATVG